MNQRLYLIMNNYRCDLVMIAYGNILYDIQVPTDEGVDTYRLEIPVKETTSNDVFKIKEIAANLMKWIKPAMQNNSLKKIYQRKFESYGK